MSCEFQRELDDAFADTYRDLAILSLEYELDSGHTVVGGPLPPPLRASLLSMRQQIVEHRHRLKEEGEQPPVLYPMLDHGLALMTRALRGHATRQEVEEYLTAIEAIRLERHRSGDTRYDAERDRWEAVFRQLAKALDAELDGPQSSAS